MGQKSGSQTVSNDPWAPSFGDRTNILSEARGLYRGGQPLAAPSRDSFYRNEAIGGGGSLMSQQNIPGAPGWNQPAAYRGTTSRVFDQSGYDAALRNYQAGLQPQSDPVQDAISGYRNMANDFPHLEQNTYGHLNDIVSGKYLGQGNPYLENMIQQTNAGVNANFSGAGRYGSGAHSGYLADAGNKLRYEDYGAERGRMMQAAAMAPTAAQLRYLPAQQRIDAAMMGEELPWQRLSRYADMVNAASGSFSQQTSPIYRNKTAGALGGAASGAALGSMFGPMGMGIGAAAGGLFGMM
jgi:hypothetical protein